MVYTHLFNLLCEKADAVYSGRLPVHVRCLIDEMANIGQIPNVLKSGILSNAESFLMLHNHPSGEIMPSEDDIKTTLKVVEAGIIMRISCLDHIIIGGGYGNYFSMREEKTVDFTSLTISMTAEEQMAKAAQEGKTAVSRMREEVTIKFGKGLFTQKNGREFMWIRIPHQDQSDKTPWASFVLSAKAVHENQYGKGLWAKLLAAGSTVVTKLVLKGKDDAGKNIWEDLKTKVTNQDLKSMVEAYKTRAPQARASKTAAPPESAREKLDALGKETETKLSADKSLKAKLKAKKGPER